MKMESLLVIAIFLLIVNFIPKSVWVALLLMYIGYRVGTRLKKKANDDWEDFQEWRRKGGG